MNAATKTAKFTVICKSMDKIYEIYLFGCKEGPLKVTKIGKVTKSTKASKYTVIREAMDKISKIYS